MIFIEWQILSINSRGLDRMMTKERFKRIMREMSLEYIINVSKWMLRETYFAISPAWIYWHRNGKRDYVPVENEYTGKMSHRMSERGLECRLLLDKVHHWKESGNENIIEVGAVSPYCFPGLIKEILDVYDKNESVTKRIDLFDFDFTGYDVISISTIEHVGTGDYGNEVRNDATAALNKIMTECRHCLITFPIGYNKLLDKYVYHKLGKEVLCYKRGKHDNNFVRCTIEECIKTKYSRLRYADAIAVIEK